MDIHWIYLIGVVSLSLAGCLALLMWLAGKTKKVRKMRKNKHELLSDPFDQNKNIKRAKESLRYMIDEVIGNPSEESPWMESLWREKTFILQNSHFKVAKALLLSLFPKLKIQHYKNFSIQILSELEEKLLYSGIPLVKLIEKRKNLYFKGYLGRSKAFRLFFEDSERNKEQQIYFFHFQSKESYQAVLFLILDDGVILSKEDLQAILDSGSRVLSS